MSQNTHLFHVAAGPSYEDIIRDIANAMREVVVETPDNVKELDPEKVWKELAERLVVRLSSKELVIIWAYRLSMAEASTRISNIFTQWMCRSKDAGREPIVEARIGAEGKFEVTAKDTKDTPKALGFFRGESLQDAYAQAAQVIACEGHL